jgi:phage/plasmid primase-like uncharacterized protein
MSGSLAELAQQLNLKRSGREWRGACPACGYVDAFRLSEGKVRPIGWCASCGDKAAIAQVLGSPHTAATSQPQETYARDTQARLERAGQLWTACVAVPGTPAANHLEARGIGHLTASPALRFHPNCPHPSGTRERAVRLPALIAAVRDVDGAFIGIHRTYLKRDGSAKADIEPPRATLGPVWGGAVRLDPAAPELVIGEGIESSASAGRLLGLPAWAAVSAGNLAKGLALPAEVRSVVIAVDRDRAGEQAASEAWHRWRAEGRVARLLWPQTGGEDCNDVLMAEHAREAAP